MNYVEVNKHTGERHVLYRDELVLRLQALRVPAVTVTGLINSLDRGMAPKIDLDHQWFRIMESRDTYMSRRPEWVGGLAKEAVKEKGKVTR